MGLPRVTGVAPQGVTKSVPQLFSCLEMRSFLLEAITQPKCLEEEIR